MGYSEYALIFFGIPSQIDINEYSILMLWLLMASLLAYFCVQVSYSSKIKKRGWGFRRKLCGCDRSRWLKAELKGLSNPA